LQGEMTAEHGSAVLSTLVRLATERVLQEALEQEQAEALGRDRYERTEERGGHRNGYEPGPVKTAEGVLRLELPPIRGDAAPYRSRLGEPVKGTSDVLRTLIQEMYVNGLSQRDIEQTLETALGQFVVSKSTVSTLTDSVVEEYEAFRQRDLRGYDVAYLFIDPV
jgi:putative transposase